MSKKKSMSPTMPVSPRGPRYDLEPPVAVVAGDPPLVVVHHEVPVADVRDRGRAGPSVEHQTGARNVPMTPYGGSLVAVSSDLGDNW